MEYEETGDDVFPVIANCILLFEYFLLFLFLIRTYFKQQQKLKRPSKLISLFYSFLISTSLIRILLFLDVGLDYSLSAYTIILYLGSLPYFSAASIMIHIWLDIYVLTRWDIQISKRFLFISRFKFFEVALNMLIWILFFILAICSALNLYAIQGLSRGVNILEAVLSFIIMCGILFAGGILGRNVRKIMNYMPGHLVPWIIVSIITTAYRFISHLLVLFSHNLWGSIERSSLWSIFLIVDINCSEIIPIITFVYCCKSCIGFIRNTHSTIDSSETNSMDHFKMLYK